MKKNVIVPPTIQELALEKDIRYLLWWCCLCNMAAHEDKELLVGGVKVEVKRGQLITSLYALCKAFAYRSNHNKGLVEPDKKVVRNFLSVLEQNNLITKSTTIPYTVPQTGPQTVPYQQMLITFCKSENYRNENLGLSPTLSPKPSPTPSPTLASDSAAENSPKSPQVQTTPAAPEPTQTPAPIAATPTQTPPTPIPPPAQPIAPPDSPAQTAVTVIEEIEPEEVTYEEVASKTAPKPKRTRKVFTPPSVEEVAAYIKEKQYPVNPEAFVNFYESKGWMVGRNPMKDWKAAVRTWASNSRNYYHPNQPNTSNNGYTSTQQLAKQQRDDEFVDLLHGFGITNTEGIGLY